MAAIDKPHETSGAASFDPRTLRDAFGAFATGVTIVTTRDAIGLDVGLTANSFSSVSLKPPMVLWSLANSSSSVEAFRTSNHFAVHVLSTDQDSLSTQFAKRDVDRFAGVATERGPGGIPVLKDYTARFVCRTRHRYEGGDHIIFVGEILEFQHSRKPPLLFHGGRYGMLLPRDALEPDIAAESRTTLTPNDLLFYVSQAYFRMRQHALKKRRQRGWTEEEYAIISVLGHEDGLMVRELAARTEAKARAITSEMLSRLEARGMIRTELPVKAENFVWLTQAGRDAVMEIMSILKAGEIEAVAGLDRSEVHVLKSLLARIAQASTRTATP